MRTLPSGRKENIVSREKRDQILLTRWAADCAERVLPIFETRRPHDDRPRGAIKAARAWARGQMKAGAARYAALAAHAAARRAREDPAKAAARAAAHAAATAHMAGHSRHAANYAFKAASSAGRSGEREWQRRHLASRFRSLIFPGSEKK